MKSFIKTKGIMPLLEVARRYSAKPEFATLAAAYAVLKCVRSGQSFPLPSLDAILEAVAGLPSFVRAFLESNLKEHWTEFQRASCPIDEDSLIDFFSNEATMLLMESRHDFSTHPCVDQLCLGLLGIDKGLRVADLNCGIGKFVRKAWFALWDSAGTDEGLSVTGYSRNAEFAALSYILCEVTEVGANIQAQSIFIPNTERYDRVLLIPPFGMETRVLNIPRTQHVLAERFENFPELRLTSADWVFAARAASLLAPGGRAVVALPLHALNGTQSESYREFLVRNKWIEAVVSIPKGFLNGTSAGFALVVLKEGSDQIKFVDGGEYLGGECLRRLTQRTQSTQRCAKNLEPCRNVERVEETALRPFANFAYSVSAPAGLEVGRLLKDYRNLNDFDSVKSVSIERVFKNECNLSPDFYLGEDLVYNNSHPFGDLVKEIRRGAKLPVETWKAVDGDAASPVRKVAFKHFSEGMIDDDLPGLAKIPEGGDDAVLESGDLLISRMGFPFKVAVVEPRAEKLVADENVWIVRMGGDKTMAYYLRAYLESERGSKWLTRLSTGANMRTISAKNIEKIPVPDVEREEMEKIADELRVATLSVREARRRLEDAHERMVSCYDCLRQD